MTNVVEAAVGTVVGVGSGCSVVTEKALVARDTRLIELAGSVSAFAALMMSAACM